MRRKVLKYFFSADSPPNSQFSAHSAQILHNFSTLSGFLTKISACRPLDPGRKTEHQYNPNCLDCENLLPPCHRYIHDVLFIRRQLLYDFFDVRPMHTFNVLEKRKKNRKYKIEPVDFEHKTIKPEILFV